MEKLELHYVSNNEIFGHTRSPGPKGRGTVVFYVVVEWA